MCLEKSLEVAEQELDRQAVATKRKMIALCSDHRETFPTAATRKFNAATDCQTDEGDDEQESYPQALDATQSLWKIFRDKECHIRIFDAQFANGAGDNYLLCQIDLTKQRVAELEKITRDLK